MEFIAHNIRTISSTKEYKYDGTAYEFQESDDGLTAKAFRDDINKIFGLGGVLYTLTDDNIIERITTIDEQISIEASNIEAIKEPGIKDLIIESIELYKSPRPELHKLATEKIWDALERIKTIFVGEGLDKKQSVARLVGIMANGNEYYKTLFDSEFTDAEFFLTPIYNFVNTRYIAYCKVLQKDKSSFWGTDWGLHFCKETHKICKNALFFRFFSIFAFRCMVK